ncbi:MAG: PilN domain-containing protein [SAR324 cluster bacterium]|nr:PilN domain-containing protein [SAR324 cluster bacterium]
MLRRKSVCYVIAGGKEVWIVFEEKIIHLKSESKILTPSSIVEKCAKLRCSKIVLFLEFPWILLTFQTIIPLSRVDAIRYSRNLLGFHYSNPEQFSKIGVCLFDVFEKNKKGLFCASLPPRTVELLEDLRKQKRGNVEPIPLLYACVSEIFGNTSEKILFYGLNQVAFIEKREDLLQKITLIPGSESKEVNEKIIEDYFSVSSSEIHSLHLSKCFPDQLDSSTHISIFSIAQHWKGNAKHIKNPFWWEKPEISWKNQWRWIGVIGWIFIMIGLIVWDYSAIENNRELQQNLNKSLQRIKEDQTKINQFKAYTEQQEHFIQVGTIYQHLKDSSVMVKKILEQLIGSMSASVWIEKLSYQEQSLELNLVALETSLIPQVLEHLEQTPMIDQVFLKSQQMSQLNQRDVVKFVLHIELNVENVKNP